MDRPALMALVLALMLVLLLLMLLGWKARQRRQRSLPAPRPVPSELGTQRFSSPVFYVATTLADEPLNRVAVAGLGYRARASVAVTDLGVVLEIPGERGVFIPAAEIRGVDRATWTIDRVVERDGLVLLAWSLCGAETTVPVVSAVPVDSYLRITDEGSSHEFIAAVTRLTEATSSSAIKGERA